ncbi:hypothetical protein RND81_12G211200 [Saponaria officinalis]|uniref:Uncharacterized protein n=1 Tax=Saponaria officinalis TaxID=3572 RepID=A0AAW1HDM1_SAPOF
MSNTCGNCDCADKTQCVKGNQYGFTMIENHEFDDGMVVMEGCGCGNGCSCGAACGCTNCGCCK